jgi:hypothetical protein
MELMVSPTDKSPGKGSESSDSAGQAEEVVSMSEVMAAVEEAAQGKRVQQSFYISEAAKERLRALAYWGRASVLAEIQRGEEVDPNYVLPSVAGGVERGMWWVILEGERVLNGGKPFPPAPAKLPTGPSAEGVERLRDFQQKKHAQRRLEEEEKDG